MKNLILVAFTLGAACQGAPTMKSSASSVSATMPHSNDATEPDPVAQAEAMVLELLAAEPALVTQFKNREAREWYGFAGALATLPRGVAYEHCAGSHEDQREQCINEFARRGAALACDERLLRALTTFIRVTPLRETMQKVVQDGVALACVMRTHWVEFAGRVDDSKDCDAQTGICQGYLGYRSTVFAHPAFDPFRTEDEYDWSAGNPKPTGKKILPFVEVQHTIAFLYRRGMGCGGTAIFDLYIKLGEEILGP